MQTRKITTIVAVVAVLALLLATSSTVAGPPVDEDGLDTLSPLGVAFTYQGQLRAGDEPVNDTCDFRFILYDADIGGSQVGSMVTQEGVLVSNGLFTVQLDFGSEAFAGDARWLEIAVRCPAGNGSYTLLSPRQAVTAAPYALYALRAPWSGLTGVPEGFVDGVDDDTTYAAGTGLTLSDDQFSLSAAYRLPQACANGEVAKWDGTAWTCGADAGDITAVYAGEGLTGGGESDDVTLAVGATYRLPQTCSNSQIAEWNGSVWVCGDDDTGAGGDFWSLTGNAGTNPTTNFLGTTDDQALELRVNDARALRLEPNATIPNLIGGHSDNSVTAGAYGASIGGGGSSSGPNRVTDDYGTVGGGYDNRAGDEAGSTNDAVAATVGGGSGNVASGSRATIGGGTTNTARGELATVGGGAENDAVTYGATIAGGQANEASGNYATIGGGYSNEASGDKATVGGGYSNEASGEYATVSGGLLNEASGDYATIAGGGYSTRGNRVTDDYGTVGGGGNNQAGDDAGTTDDATYATVGGGGWNTASGYHATVGGGYGNEANGEYATVPGGYQNTAQGSYSFAAGRGAGANHDGAFVWADSTGYLASTANDQFLVQATGGVELIVGGYGSGLRLEPASDPVHGFSPNLIGGFGGNSVSDGVAGVTIGGGGVSGNINRVSDNGGTVSGGVNNQAGNNNGVLDDALSATVGGGTSNEASGSYATVGGGMDNQASGDWATVGGGFYNKANGDYATIAGGGPSDLGSLDTTNNRVTDDYGTVSGGGNNRAGNDDVDTTNAMWATVGGGFSNTARRWATTVGGGDNNDASGSYGTVSGGDNNDASGSYGTVGGGVSNDASGYVATVGGGAVNEASGSYATVPGGYDNTAQGSYSFAAGRRAKANHEGTFVWADSTSADFASTGSKQFLIRAAGGFGLGTNDPATQFHVIKNVSGAPLLANHVAVIENTSTGSSPDVLALKVGRSGNPSTAVNFISFRNGDDDYLGAIQGNGSGGVELAGPGNDFAEWLPRLRADEAIEPGDIVGIFGGKITKATQGAQHVMVVSSGPIVAGNSPGENRHLGEQVAFLGQVPVKVRGAVHAGDYIVPSGRGDGTGVAVPPQQINLDQIAQVVGRAWESSDQKGVKPITVLVGLPQDQLWYTVLQEKETRIADLEARVTALEQAVGAPRSSQSNLPGGWLVLGGLVAAAVVVVERRHSGGER